MTRRTELHAVALAVLACASPMASAVVLTGEVQAVDAQLIHTPEANMVPVTIRYFVPEGQKVKKGDVLLRVDAGQAAAQIPEVEAQVEQAKARAAKEVAVLQVKAVDAEIALVEAEAALEKARIDAKIPSDLISRLDYDRYQGELDRAAREAKLKQSELANARAAVKRRTGDGQNDALYDALREDYELVGNINVHALDVNSDAIATAVLTFAYDTSTVNGAPGHPGRGLVKPGVLERSLATMTDRHAR